MTLPEIKPENEQPKTKCQFCGKEGASKAHERFCSSNPNNPRSKKKSAMKHEPILETPIIPPPQTPAEPLIISDVQPYIGDMVAWYNIPDKEYFLVPYYIGIVNHIPFVLVQCVDGALVPPYTITGFVGMYPENKTFPETKTDDEPFPPFEVAEEKEEVKPVVLAEKISFNPECKPTEKPVKKHWWSRTPKPVAPKTPDKELIELVEGAINVTG